MAKKGIENHRVCRIADVSIQYHIKVKAEANPFLPQYDRYFCKKEQNREQIYQRNVEKLLLLCLIIQ
jgi:RNA-directed DNA polymerase